MFVITILADMKKAPLNQEFVDSMTPSLGLQGITVQKSEWLETSVACQLTIDQPIENTTLHAILADQPYDAITRPADAPAIKLLISDMDSTMIEQECIDELADFVGKKAEVSAITERAMNGELDFAAALIERVGLLEGLPEEVLQECFDERISLMPGAKALLSAHKKNGGTSILVSGGFTFFTSRVSDKLGFDNDFANQLEMNNGCLTGRVVQPILGKEAKLEVLQTTCKKMGIASDQVLAIGDGANDLPMLLAAGVGVAYRAKPSVRAAANQQLNHCNLSALTHIL